jgi:thioredoxin reductase (NADPH)
MPQSDPLAPDVAPPRLPPALEARRSQIFPVLSAEELARMHRFGEVLRYRDGERLFETGKPAAGMFVVLAGAVRIMRRDGIGHELPLVEHGVGEFTAEIGQLSGTPAFVDGYARGEVTVILIKPERLRALLIAEADLGEKLMRALILRRVGLIETGSGGPVLIGSPASPGVIRLRNFLSRNGYPHQSFDPDSDADARAFIERYVPLADDMPLVVCPDGTVLRNPAESVLAKCIGMIDRSALDTVHDVAIVGAGPAGLAAAVYAASEGLSVVVLEARAFGGQAGASARIENYLGFPTGISGQALTGRAYTQAQKFGARMIIPSTVAFVTCPERSADGNFSLQLSDGRSLKSRAVVVATGARYRRPECENLRAMEGRGVWYWASPIEARACAGEEVALVGGGNSAGQAAVYLAGHAAKVWMLIRGTELSASMSRYLIDRIAATPNIELRTRTEIRALSGSPESGVEAVHWRHRDTKQDESHPIRNVFMFLGADPATDWLKSCDIALDAKGFVKTGLEVDPAPTERLALETSVPGMFAIGDVRAGSVKRVGGAIGEGAAVVAQLHAYLARQADAAAPAR